MTSLSKGDRISVPMEEDGLDNNDVREETSDDGMGEWHDAIENGVKCDPELDCYPYTFTPLLLFAESSYFDKGYSNYNSVAQFFSPVLKVDMLENVLFDRKDMLYEDLLDMVLKREMVVTCCIDSHFTAFQAIAPKLRSPMLLYYDPLKPNIQRVTGDGCRLVVAFLLLKCNYGDSQHIQENKDHYTGTTSNSTRRMIYQLWNKINTLDDVGSLNIRWARLPLNLNRYLLINDRYNPQVMSTQKTGNTCYFQTFLFAVLCKVCKPFVGREGVSIDFQNIDALEEATSSIARFLLEFFSEDRTSVMRPLTNNNFVLDFYRYEASPYYATMTHYIKTMTQNEENIPDYERQYRDMLQYFQETKCLHKYSKFTLDGAMSSTPNTKSLQPVSGTEDAVFKLARSHYYKYRAANLMFGFNSSIMYGLLSFCEFNALRKNQLLSCYELLRDAVGGCVQELASAKAANKYRDYYFMPQFEVGQKELVDIHHYTFLIDHCAMTEADSALVARIHAVNSILYKYIFFSTQKRSNYDTFLSTEEFRKAKKYFRYFLKSFMSTGFLSEFIGLGFADINPKEKEINSLTQTVFYSSELMRTQAHRQSYEFEKECINQMARSTLRKYSCRFEGGQDQTQKYKICMNIGRGHTYSKYNTLMHFLNVAECYWMNPDLSNIQVFGKDIRSLLSISCQKIFFEEGHTFYHYGPFEIMSSAYRSEVDLAVATSIGHVLPGVASLKRNGLNELVITDRVFEYGYLKGILTGIFHRVGDNRFKTDNEVLNLCLLSLMLDFGLYDDYVHLLNLPFLQCLQHSDTRELQVEISNLIYEFDRKNQSDSVTRSKVEELIFEASYKFLINKDFPVISNQFKLIRLLNGDPDYQSYLLLCKIYMSLCQINKSVEVDYYKVYCNGEFRIIIPQNFSKTTSDYLDVVTTHYTFSEHDGVMIYDGMSVFDLRPQQPEINLHRVRFESATAIQSMVKYIEIANVFRVADSEERYLVFIANNCLVIDANKKHTKILINKIAAEIANIFFNEAISFVPCFKYTDSEDVILFTSQNIHYLVDQAGQFCTDYYGMKHELIDCIKSEEVFVDLNDEHKFKTFKLSELLTESKTVIYFPDYLLQVPNRQQLINLLDLAIHIRNISFFILVLFYLRRGSVSLEFVEQERKVKKITGPWKEAILYVLNRAPLNAHYDSIFERQFFDLNHHEYTPLTEFIEFLCNNFKKYQRFTEDGQYQIVPTQKQKAFLRSIICAEKCFHFSEVGSGKTKVILPLLCQTFLSNNAEAHKFLARGGKSKNVLIILVPEHLVQDARTQVFRYCLNLNFREEYRVYDDIFALLHKNVQLGAGDSTRKKFMAFSSTPMKQIFVTSFNSFKKALTYDSICAKVQPHREHILVVADEVDDFLDSNKLVFNICSNKNNNFGRKTLDLFFEVSRAAYRGNSCPDVSFNFSTNPKYWDELFKKFCAIHKEIQDASRSINKSFGIFNEQTLRHCSTNIVHDIEGYKSLIARPYESVNRAMPGSYYSDVERTIYLTFVILTEDIAKYDVLFQGERKFISFEYWNAHFVHQLDYDDLVYGHEKLSEIVDKHPQTKDGLTRFLYDIILRRMEIRDKSRSVSSIDVIFNFDCIGFTGTPFLDNYPTFNYIRQQRKDDIPDLIDRSFYAYTSDKLPITEFEERFARFQGRNNNVNVEYLSSDFIRDLTDELVILKSILTREKQTSPEESGRNTMDFNAIVDLCGIFKRSSIHDVRDLIKSHFGPDQFHYIYHIDQADNSDRVLCVNSDNDVQFDEEFYKHMCKTYGQKLRHKIFFFVDNRNVIGKDIPFQLIFQRHFGQPLFTKSIILAHDVDDFSKIWQAMGRSRTMNETIFSIYKSGLPDSTAQQGVGAHDIKKQELTRLLYVCNCDRKMAGNTSSIYLTLVALLNLSQVSFYFCDNIVNTFLEKMNMTIGRNIVRHEEELVRYVIGKPVSAQILLHILKDKFKRSSNKIIAGDKLTVSKVEMLLRQIVKQKFEQREITGDIYDDFINFLSGEQQSQMEISYTKQQQKQKQKQSTKNQDSDAMGVFDKRNQLNLSFETGNYYAYTLSPKEDLTKILLNLPVAVPILKIEYNIGGSKRIINVYPTIQFLYSHYIQEAYISEEVQSIVKPIKNPSKVYASFLAAAKRSHIQGNNNNNTDFSSMHVQTDELPIKVLTNNIRQNPQYTIAALWEGVYIIGTKDQFNMHMQELQDHPIYNQIQYIMDDQGFVLFDKTHGMHVDAFGPYFIEQYILMEVLSKQEIAQNVLDYYCKHKKKLLSGLEKYNEKQGKGFICWRFLMNEITKATIQDGYDDDCCMSINEGSKNPIKRSKVSNSSAF